MKKLLFSVSVAMTLGTCLCAQTVQIPSSSEGYVINGYIFPEYEGKIYLAHEGQNGLIKVDSTTVTDGRYTFKGGHIENPELHFIQANDKYESRTAPFILEDGNIRLRTPSLQRFYASEMGGSISNAIFYAYIKQNDYSSKDSISYAYNIEILLAAQQGKDLTQDNEAFRRRSQLGTERGHHYQQVYFDKYKDQFFGLLLLRKSICYRMSPQALETAMKSISPRYKNHPYMKDLEKILESKQVIPGYEAPDFETTDINGNKVRLSDFRGKVVLLDFWASWCGPCRRELPNVKEVYKKFGDRIEIIGVSLDKKEKAWKDAINNMELNWIHVSDLKGFMGHIPMTYNVQAIPKAFLIDEKGIIRYMDLRGKDLGEKVEELLSK